MPWAGAADRHPAQAGPPQQLHSKGSEGWPIRWPDLSSPTFCWACVLLRLLCLLLLLVHLGGAGLGLPQGGDAQRLAQLIGNPRIRLVQPHLPVRPLAAELRSETLRSADGHEEA